jgi:flavin reductase (DIM6/NTAB) family NADH-FMN oxidoreductase RutF
MAAWASGVTVVTATGPDGPVGLTASSFSSVSLDPPLVSVCVDSNGTSHAGVTTAEGFAVHVLDDSQETLSNRFARPSVDRFAPDDWHTGPFEAPLLPLGLARIVCARHHVVEAGDHTIIIGRVVEVETSQGKPLLYWAGKYRGLAVDD